MENIVEQLFTEGKLLVRAMDTPRLRKDNDEYFHDFSVWASEYELFEREGLYSVSSTLILENEGISTYKSIGFLIDSDKVEVTHVSESDCCSSGNDKYGDFNALAPNLKTLSNLEKVIHVKHEGIMNEVNFNMKEGAYVGLFVNKCISKVPLTYVLFAQKHFEMQSGIELPIYVYDSKIGDINKLDMSIEEKRIYVQDMIDQRIIRSSKISYETSEIELVTEDYLLPRHIVK